MLSRILAVIVLMASVGCATASSGAPPSATASDQQSQSCSFDTQCPGGSCRFGTCSPFPPDTDTASPSPSTPSSSCFNDMQCPGGSCQMGSCSPFPATNSN